MLTPTSSLVMRFVLAAAVTLPAAVYAADAPHADATGKDACIKACNECLRACRECIMGCDCPGCEKTCLTRIETCRTCIALLEYDSALAKEMCEFCEDNATTRAGRCGGEAYEEIIGSERTLIRWGSSTTTAPRSILGAISARLASNSLTWPIGFRGVAPRNRITDGLAVFRMARMVPKSVSAETITR